MQDTHGRPARELDQTRDDISRVFGGLALKNFRQVRQTPTSIVYGWDEVSADVVEIWAWGRLSPQDADPPLPPGADEDRLWRDTEADPPDMRLDPTTQEFEVTIPTFGYIQTWELLPIGKQSKRGYPQRIKTLSVQDIPRITNLKTTQGASELFTDITRLEVNDPQALGGTLRVWLNKNFPDDANPADVPDGTLAISLTPRTVEVLDDFVLPGGGTAELFDNVRIHPGAGKRVFFEFINSRGVSSGIIDFTILSNGGIIDTDGILKDDSINRAEQIVASMTVPSVYDVLPATGRDNELAVWTGDFQMYRWNGSEWVATVPAPQITGQMTAAQIGDYIIGLNKIAPTIAAPEILSSLPVPPGVNRVAYYTVDGQLYRSTPDGLAWTKAVAAVDLTGTISTAQIALNAITGPLIAAAAITSTNIQDGAISTPKLMAGAVTANELAAGSVTTGKILAGAVTAITIDAGAVTTSKLAANAVTANELAANSVTAGKVAAAAIGANEIAALSITSGKIGAGEIVTNHMAVGTISGDRISVNSLHGSRITALSITANELAAGSIIAAKIQAGAVTATAILAGSVTSTKLSISLLSDITTNAGIIVAGKLQSIDGLRYLDLNATGSNPFLQHPSITLRSDGTAVFGGVVSGSSFTGANATFSNGITIATGNLFIGNGYVIAVGSNALGPRITHNGNDLLLSGATSGTSLIGNVVKQVGGIPGTPIPVAGVVFTTTTPPTVGNYRGGDFCIKATAPVALWINDGGSWVQLV